MHIGTWGLAVIVIVIGMLRGKLVAE